MAAATTSRLEAAGATLGLRERKKIKTRQAIRHAAYRLFEEQGYDATTVEQIAAAAEVSPSTFFRYFPTKEDVVLIGEYDPLLEAALLARPADEPMVESLRQTAMVLAREMGGDERKEMLQRLRLVQQIPAIRARLGGQMTASSDLLVQAIARRTGRPATDLEIRVLVGAVLGGWQEALMHWVENNGTKDPVDLLDRTFRILARQLQELGT